MQYTLTGENAGSKVLSASALLATADSAVAYDDDANGSTAAAVAYNGYISETLGANWADALNFVSELNGATYSGTKGSTDTVITNSYSPKNTSKIVPSGQTGGQWRLLTVYESSTREDANDTPGYQQANTLTALDGAAWAKASGGSSAFTGLGMSDYKTIFGGVYALWSSQEDTDDSGDAYGWICNIGSWAHCDETLSRSDTGFVVVWDPS